MSESWGWWTIFKRIEENTENYDVDDLLKPPLKRIGNTPKIENIERMSNDDLGELLSYCGSYVAYMNTEVARFDGRLSAVSSSLRVAMNRAIAILEAEAPKKRLTASLEGEAIQNDPLIAEGKRLEIELEAQLRVAKGYRDAWDLLWQTASREITRRNNMLERRM